MTSTTVESICGDCGSIRFGDVCSNVRCPRSFTESWPAEPEPAKIPDTGAIVRRLILSRARLLESGCTDTDARRAWREASLAYERATGRRHPQGAAWLGAHIND